MEEKRYYNVDEAIAAWNTRTWQTWKLEKQGWSIVSEGGGRMSESRPCPICGDDDEFLRFLDLCAEKANEKWREDEVKNLVGIYKAMDFIQVVRCRDCTYNAKDTDGICYRFNHEHFNQPDGFCAWGERKKL